eukprot:TRINITY_DN17184_c0_g1_i1.p1 TRINITY_DN17184_c0_g1~~TRINITY_DN17184_c0_g1_i1.p1  ORF type:complete len:172 (-),score=28.26 TRINITY_DN17184_c0_g1_i1:60-575(-)
MRPAIYDLFEAVHGGDSDAVRTVLKHGNTTPNHKRDHRDIWPIHMAAYQGNTAVVGILLEYHANPNLQIKDRDSVVPSGLPYCKQGDTALHIAARRGYIDIVKLLLSHHGDTRIKNQNNETPADCASKPAIRALFMPETGGGGSKSSDGSGGTSSPQTEIPPQQDQHSQQT